MRRSLDAVGLTRILVVSPGRFSREARALSIPVYRQDFEALAAKSYQCLQWQNRPGWVAETYRVRGELIACSYLDKHDERWPGRTTTGRDAFSRSGSLLLLVVHGLIPDSRVK